MPYEYFSLKAPWDFVIEATPGQRLPGGIWF